MKRLACLCALLAATPVMAQGFADPAAIDRAVSDFAPDGQPRPVDRRLRLAACSSALALSWYGARRESVLVRCPDAGGWRLYVPLDAAARSPDTTPAVLRGEAVTVAIEGEGFAVTQSGEALDPGPVGAWIRVRTAAAAQPLRARIVRPGLVRIAVGSDLP